MFIKGKTALVTGAATGIGLEYVKALLQNGAQVSNFGLVYCHVREAVQARLRSHDFLEEEGIVLRSNLSICQRSIVYQKPQFLTEVLHVSTLLFRSALANYFNISHTRFLARHFLFTHRQIITVMYSKCCL